MRTQMTNIRFGGPLTPMVKKLMIVNAAIFVLQLFAKLFLPGTFDYYFGLHHEGLTQRFMIWQLCTYMFLHGGFMHIFFNLLTLFMFAGDLEERWGSRLFIRYYLFSGIGAGIFIALMNAFVSSYYGVNPVTIGASGALYAILLAYGLTWPNREVLLYFLIPVKMKYLVLVFGLIEFFGTVTSAQGSGGNISHIGHLGGIISGFIFIIYKLKIERSPGGAYTKSEGIIARFLRKRRLNKKRHEIETRIEAKKIIDALLEKIARHGMSSLTATERKNLEWARRHYYPDNHTTIH